MLSKNSFGNGKEIPKNIFVYVGEMDTFKTNMGLRIISSNLVRTFLEGRTGYSLVIMDVTKFKRKQTLFNDFDVEHPRVLKKMLVYPVGCLDDIRLLLASLIKLQTPPLQILVDGIDGFANNQDTSGSTAIDAGLSSTLFMLNEYAQVSMTESDVEKKIVINYRLSPKDELQAYSEDTPQDIPASSSDKKPKKMDAEGVEPGEKRMSSTSGKNILASLAVVDIAFLAKLSTYATSIVQVFRDPSAQEWPLMLERKLVIEGNSVRELPSSDKDVRDLNELFMKMQMASERRQEEEQHQIDQELK